jgi:hypothetical protein
MRRKPKGLHAEVVQLVDDLRARGWHVRKSAGGHYRAAPPDKDQPLVFFSSTPSDRAWRRQAVAQLRRSGYRDE